MLVPGQDCSLNSPGVYPLSMAFFDFKKLYIYIYIYIYIYCRKTSAWICLSHKNTPKRKFCKKIVQNRR